MQRDPNVFIFGAGTSVDAKVPLLSVFMDQMRAIRRRGRIGYHVLDEKEKKIMEAAEGILQRLRLHHTRASFDDGNIEDILSILSLSIYKPGMQAKADIEKFVSAIALTIDRTCSVEPVPLIKLREGYDVYNRFWRALINNAQVGRVATIITMNYDLVLERSLIAALVGGEMSQEFGDKYDTLVIQHRYGAPKVYYINRKEFLVSVARNSTRSGYVLTEAGAIGSKPLYVEILKLHGSLSFSKHEGILPDIQISVPEPLIVPPVVVKRAEDLLHPIWEAAMEALSMSTNVVFCGYSLPPSDTYMRYFLKAALGPNDQLQSVRIFDPVLYAQDSQSMINRFSSIFAAETFRRINFDPGNTGEGTFASMVDLLTNGSVEKVLSSD